MENVESTSVGLETNPESASYRTTSGQESTLSSLRGAALVAEIRRRRSQQTPSPVLPVREASYTSQPSLKRESAPRLVRYKKPIHAVVHLVGEFSESRRAGLCGSNKGVGWPRLNLTDANGTGAGPGDVTLLDQTWCKNCLRRWAKKYGDPNVSVPEKRYWENENL